MNAVPISTRRAGFVDDDPAFLKTMTAWQAGVDMPVRTTTRAEELLNWVRSREVDVVVSDLRMPGRDGVAVLEEVHRLNPHVSLVLLTSFDPNPGEMQRLGNINADIYFKTSDLPAFLDSLLEHRENSTTEPEPIKRLAELQARVNQLEALNREWAEDLIIQLQQIPDVQKAMIKSSTDEFTVKDLIEDITELRPRGIEHIRLWRKALARLRGMGKV